MLASLCLSPQPFPRTSAPELLRTPLKAIRLLSPRHLVRFSAPGISCPGFSLWVAAGSDPWSDQDTSHLVGFLVRTLFGLLPRGLPARPGGAASEEVDVLSVGVLS